MYEGFARKHIPLIEEANVMSPVVVTHQFRKCSNSESESDNKYKENLRHVFFISLVNLHFKVKKESVNFSNDSYL